MLSDLKDEDGTINPKVEAERQKYARGILKIAVKGREKVQEAFGKFRNVRMVMIELVNTAKAVHAKKGDSAGTLQELAVLADGVNILEVFQDHISQYATWWNSMEMAHNCQESKTKTLVVNYNSLSDRIIVAKWKTLRDQYIQYTNSIRAMQDSYPKLFVESRK
ncbi:hypothetical protein B0H34DRAFT_387516 [Crassisporium funariophilum]|nr:hypothetical protein B0H34DRAFT_387516 [Crassisporium funariophilum]